MAIMMNKAERLIDNLLCLFFVIALVGFAWQGVEMVFYGEIQPRKVDDIMAIIWMALLIKSYKRGFKHGKEDNQWTN